MKRVLLVLFVLAAIFFFTSANIFAQTTINGVTYRFNAANSSPVGIVPTQLIGPNSDNVASAVTDIGFNFYFAGTLYTQFSVSENGLMTLGSTQISGTDFVNSMASGTTNPKIAPYWDDLATGTNGSVAYYLSGVAPNRILYVNWNVTVPKNAAGAANATFQAQLYEASGSIYFSFGSPAIAANAAGYSMGVGNSATDFASVTVAATQTSSTAAYGIAKDNNTLSAGAGKRYQFGTDYTAPTISTQLIPNTFGSANRTLVKTITDLTPYNGTGVPTSGGLVPRIYYKKSTDVSYVSTPGVFTSGTNINGTWTFTVDHSLIGGVAGGDQIQYFVIAQDQSVAVGHPNISSYPAGVAATDVNTITTPPASPSVYFIGSEFLGTKTVGAGGNFASLTLAGGIFEQINAGQLSGNLTINIISDLTGETGLNALNAWANGTGGPFTVTINPVGARTITSSGPIKLNGTQSAIIDGLNDGTNSLIINSSGNAISMLAGASNNTITRTTIKGYSSSGAGVITVSNSTATPCNNNTISYCTITSSTTSYFAYQGICFTGTASTGSGNIIDHNIFTNFGYAAVHKEYTSTSRFVNFTISNNELYNTVASSERNYYKGIWLESTTGTSNIFNNKIHDLLVTYNTMSGAGVWGINTSNTAGDITNIYNNVISFDGTVNSPLQAWFGISVANAGTSNIYYNSIYIGGSSTNSSIARGIEKSAVGNGEIRNNVTYIPRTGSVNSGLSLAGTFTQSNNFSGDPGFTSPTNLQPDINNPNSNNLDGHGVPIATIGNDILGNLRSTSLPTPTDIGAYEFVGAPITFTISGNTGMPGVTLSWTDVTAKTTTSDAGGAYSFTASYNWSGTVTPSLTGYTFTPANRIYSNVLADQLVQDYVASPIVFTISGNAGIAGAVLSYTDGAAKTATADAGGLYSFTVSYNWSGTVTPSSAGFSFTPVSISYTNVLANQVNQNYTTAPVLFTISGNTGTAGVTLNWTDGIAKSVTSDAGGLYSFTVSYNWSGSVTPSLTGFTFAPSVRNYLNVLADQTTQDYIATPNSYLIMGNTGIGAATLSWFDGVPKTATSSVDGDYFIAVSYNWSGTVTPSKTGYTFSPVNIAYTNVMTNQLAQNYVAAPITFTITGNTGMPGVTLSWVDNGPLAPVKIKTPQVKTASKNIKNASSEVVSKFGSDAINKLNAPNAINSTSVSDASGNYTITVSYNWSGTLTPSLTGYSFTPANTAFTNVLANQANQNFAVAPIVYTISGNAGIAGATLSYTDGTPKTATADVNGLYSFTVSYNWSGSVTPLLTGYTFAPVNIAYTNVLADQVNQNYTTTAIVYTISGNAGIAGATLSYTDGTPKTATADVNGLYSFTVSYNWSGTVTPSLTDYTFSPAFITYTNITINQSGQNYVATPNIVVNAKVFLSGPFNNGVMTTLLNSNGFIPLTSETGYAAATYGYTARSVAGIPNADIVDWLLVELRTGTAANTKVTTQAGFLKKDGTIVDIDGISLLKFINILPGNYYVVIRHRNHLAIMSANPLTVSSTSLLYDFTTAQSQAYGINPMASLAGGVFGMIGGDLSRNGQLKYSGTGNDRGLILIKLNGNILSTLSGYYDEDVNINGQVKYSGSGNDRGIILQGLNGNTLGTLNTQVPN